MATFPFVKNKIKTRIATIFLFQLSFSSYQNNNNNNDSYNGNVIHVELIANGYSNCVWFNYLEETHFISNFMSFSLVTKFKN